MKKSLVARGFIGAVASLLGVVAVGCSAESGYDDQVSEVSQNLGTSAPTVSDSSAADLTTLAQTPAGHIHAASCVINDNGQNKLIVAGGYTFTDGQSTLTASTDLFEFDPSNGASGTWTKLSISLATARGELKGMQVPGDDTKCLFIGGSTGLTAAALATVEVLSANGASAYTIANGTSLNTARANFALTTCGGKPYVIGGRTSSTARTTVEVASVADGTGTWTEATGAGKVLLTGVWDFGFAKKPSEDKYVVAGGHSTASSAESVITLIDGSTCSSPVVKEQGTAMTVAVQAPVAFFEGTADTFLVAGGLTTAPAASANLDKITVSNWGSTSGISLANQTALSTATYRPTLVLSYPVANYANMLIGGLSGPVSSGSAVGTLQQYQKAYGWHTASPTARFGGVAELVDGVIYPAFGATVSSGNYTKVSVVEAINP